MINNLFWQKIMLGISIYPLLTNMFQYWNDIPKSEQIELIQSEKICKVACDFYKGKLKVTDNKSTVILLDSISSLSADVKIKALYFDLFNQICINTDGALSDILGSYCQKVILSDIEYTMYYLKNNSNISSQYIKLLGSEFYFKEDETSTMQYNFNEFKDIVNNKLGCKKEYEEFLLNFYKDIYIFMNNMD